MARVASRILLALVAVLSCVPGWAGDKWIDCEFGDDVAGDGSNGRPWKSIQFGLDSAGGSDTVWIKAGTCDPSTQVFPIDIPPGISVVGAGSDQTFIRNIAPGAGATAFYFAENSQEFPRSQRLSHVNIETDTDGVILYNGSPTISNNVIRFGSNGIKITAFYDYYVSDKNLLAPLIEDNVLSDQGQGIAIENFSAPANPIIRRNWIYGDVESFGSQAGITASRFAQEDIAPVIENNVIVNSRIGISISGGSPTIVNNTVANNDSGITFYDTLYSVYPIRVNNNLVAYNAYGIDEFGDAEPGELLNNNFWANTDFDYYDGTFGPILDPNALPMASGNTFLVPLFVDPINDDYHLTLGSPVVDMGSPSGAPSNDIDRQARSGLPDIGADEATGGNFFPNLVVTANTVVTDLCPGQIPPGGDGDIDPGEVADIRIVVTNLSPYADATNVKATIVADGPAVIPASAAIDVGTVPALGSVTSSGVYSFRYMPTPFDCNQLMVRFFVDFETDETGLLPRRAFEVPIGNVAGCQLCSNPMWPRVTDLRVLSDLVDTCATGAPPGLNMQIEPGEDGTLTVSVENQAVGARASSVVVTIDATSPGITPPSAVIALGHVGPGATVAATDSYTFTVDPGQVSCGDTIRFDATLDWLELSPDAPPVLPLSYSVPAACEDCSTVLPDFLLGTRAFTDSCVGPSPKGGDNALDPGEHFDLVIDLTNTSVNAGATNVTGRLIATGGLVVPSSANVSFGDIGPTAMVMSAPVPLNVLATAPCSASLDFELELSSDQTGVIATRLPFSLLVDGGCSVCPDVLPSFSTSVPTVDDTCTVVGPGGNGVINAGEHVELTMNVLNTSPTDAHGVTVDVTIAEPWVKPRVFSLDFGDVPAGSGRPSLNTMGFDIVQTSEVCDEQLTLNLTYASDETGSLPPVAEQLTIECPSCDHPRPDLSFTYRTQDRCPFGPTDRDGKIDAGEFIDLLIDVNNASLTDPATGVRALVYAVSPGVQPVLDRVNGPDIAPGATETLEPYSFVVDIATPCDTILEFEVQLISKEDGLIGSDPATAQLDLNCEICQRASSGLLLYRSSGAGVGPGWKQSIPLPLNSGSVLIDTPAWPRNVTDPPSSQDDFDPLLEPLILYRLMSDLDEEQGNTLRVVKNGIGVRVSY